MSSSMDEKIRSLIANGVTIPNPSSIEIGDEVDPSMIEPGVTIYTGSKIFGPKTVIMKGTRLGQEAPVTVQDCQIGQQVELKGGYFKKSVFLSKSNMSYGAHVRDACILEEEANGAHTVGIKQTILLPFVTLGSLINLCDCLMAGGTSRKDHSEVGSSYIHFNYSPNQDKATASLLGDVPRGVMLGRRPIFLGGQGGLVGPSVIGYGTVIAAGTVFRKDLPEGGKIVMGNDNRTDILDFNPGLYWNVKRKTGNNINYIANLIALKAWYKHVRPMFFGSSPTEKALLKGAAEKLDLAVDERIKRLGAFAKKMDKSIELYRSVMKEKASAELIAQKQELSSNWAKMEGSLDSLRTHDGDMAERDTFLSILTDAIKDNKAGYTDTIQGLSDQCKDNGTKWLQGIADRVNSALLKDLPSFM